MRLIKLWIGCLLVFPAQVFAAKIVECVDAEGNSVFQDICPPGMTQVMEKKIYTGANQSSDTDTEEGALPAGPPEGGVTFYFTPSNCDACVVVRDILYLYETGFAEKNVESDVAVQLELKEKLNGVETLTVPTVFIGSNAIVGYQKDQLISSLEAAGYKKAKN